MAVCEAKEPFELCKLKPASKATLARAVDLFVMTKFEKCLQVCSDVIKAAKCEPEQERNHEVIEAAAALGIQALAEMDQWHHTVSFITEVYGAIHLCSARIVQVCILLHAHVEEYLPCHKLVQTWLKHPDNLNSKNCAQVIRVYGYHILLPTGQFGILEEIVQKCTSVSEEEKAALLKLPQAGRFKDAKETNSGASAVSPHQFFSSEGEISESRWTESEEGTALSYFDRNNSTSASKTSEEPVSSPEDSVDLFAVCKRLYFSFLGSIRTRWRQKFVVLVMAAFAVWALVQTQSGDPVSSLGRVVILWQGFLQRIKLLISSS